MNPPSSGRPCNIGGKLGDMSPDFEADDDHGGHRSEPPVTWPSTGSGFEADPFSPAGTVQREGLLFQGIAGRRGERPPSGCSSAYSSSSRSFRSSSPTSAIAELD